jgi:hypothetical protein
MMKQIILDTLLKKTFTRPDLLRRLSLLRSYYETVFYADDKSLTLNQYLAHKNTTEIDKSVLLEYQEIWDQNLKIDNMYKAFKKIDELVSKIPNITIYVPGEPTDVFIRELGAWVRDQIAVPVLVDIRIDPKNVGGCSFSFMGKYYDYALHHFINKNRMDILNIFKEYEHEH